MEDLRLGGRLLSLPAEKKMGLVICTAKQNGSLVVVW